MGRIWMVAGGLAGAGAVGMSAVAAHALRQLDPAAMQAMQSAIQMQGWHALALLATGAWLSVPRSVAAGRLGNLAGLGFAVGMLLFCGAIYAGHLAGLHAGPAAPTGGVLLMVAWLLLAAAALADGRAR